MRRHRALLIALCWSALLAACGPSAVPTATPPAPAAPPPSPTVPSPAATATPTGPAPEALAYLTEALDYMQAHALMRDRVDWVALRRQALTNARYARTPGETYTAIGLALQQLGDRHSTFLGPEAVRRQQQQAAQGPKPHARRLEGGLGYLALPAHFPTGDQADPYAAIAGQLVAEVDQQGTCGWVVDLRGNEGGNMWPMLVGAGPILGEGEVGAFVYPDGRREVWAYRDGQALLDGQVRAQGPAYRLACPQPPVAVLTDGLTVSAGEAIAIAFRGRPKLRSFGEPTFGLPTANDLKVMSDGAWLLLTVARMADRTSQTYDGRIVPDEVVRASGTSGGADPVVQAAVAWLHDQPDCAR